MSIKNKDTSHLALDYSITLLIYMLILPYSNICETSTASHNKLIRGKK